MTKTVRFIKRKLRCLHYLVILWLALFSVIFVTVWAERTAGSLEGRYYPVVEIASVVKVRREGPEATLVSLKTRKIRDCTLRSIDWSFGDAPDRLARTVIVSHEGPVEPQELHEPPKDEWVAYVPRRSSLLYSKVFVYHRCHPLWLTRSLLYEGSLADSEGI